MVRKAHTSIQGFAGLNVSSPGHMISERELQVCENLYFGEAGELIKRPGLREVFSSIPSPTILATHEWDLDKHLYLASEGGSLYRSVNGGVFSASIDSQVYWGASHGNDFYYGTGDTGIFKIVGTAAPVAVANSPTNSRLGVFHKNRIFVVDIAVASDQIRWSDPPGDPAFPTPFTDWPTTNTWVIGPENKTAIKALVVYNDLLYIFKENSIWALYVQGDSPAQWVLREVVSDVGIADKRSVVIADQLMYFVAINLDHNSWKLFVTEGTTFRELSEPVDRHFVDPTTNTLVNTHLVEFDDNLMFLHSASGVILVFNYKNSVWSTYQISGMTSVRQLFKSPFYLTGVPSTVYVVAEKASTFRLYRLSDIVKTSDTVYQDDGVGYTSKFRTREWMSKPDQLTRFLWAFVEYDSASGIDARYITETGLGELALAASGGTRSVIRMPAPQLRRRLAYEFDDGAAANALKFYSFGMETITRDRVAKAKMG